MHGDLTISLATVYGFLLVLARVAGVFVFVPIPGINAAPVMGRAILSLAVTIALSPLWPHPAVEGFAIGRVFGWVLAEAGFGLTVGVAIAFLLEGVQMAAQVIGLQAGYSYASTVDPSTQADTSSLQLMAQLFAGTLFFAFGFDRQIVQVLARSLERIPTGGYSLDSAAADVIVRLGAGIFTTGLQLAIPVLALLLLLDIAFAVLGRLQNQLQLLSLSFSLKMLVGIAFLASVLRFFPAIFAKSGAAAFTALQQIMGR